jgi:hypothetical protein
MCCPWWSLNCPIRQEDTVNNLDTGPNSPADAGSGVSSPQVSGESGIGNAPNPQGAPQEWPKQGNERPGHPQERPLRQGVDKPRKQPNERPATPPDEAPGMRPPEETPGRR